MTSRASVRGRKVAGGGLGGESGGAGAELVREQALLRQRALTKETLDFNRMWCNTLWRISLVLGGLNFLQMYKAVNKSGSLQSLQACWLDMSGAAAALCMSDWVGCRRPWKGWAFGLAAVLSAIQFKVWLGLPEDARSAGGERILPLSAMFFVFACLAVLYMNRNAGIATARMEEAEQLESGASSSDASGSSTTTRKPKIS